MASNKRERELARMRAERQAARRAAEAARRRQRRLVALSTLAILVVVAVAVALTLTLRGGSSDDTAALADPAASASASPSPSPSSSADARPVACGGSVPPAPQQQSYDKEPPLTIDKNATYVATLQTSCGTITMSLDAAKAPRAVNSFVFLAGKHYFDGIQISRLTGKDSGFAVAQLGDQSSDGTGGPGYTFPDENLSGAKYVRGTVAMANSGPNTNGSQFFLVDSDASLSPNYTPFGMITSGLDVLDKIIAIGNDGSNAAGGGKPKQRVYLESLTVAKK